MTQRSKTVLIDMDGTMVDFDTAALSAIPEAERVPRSSFYVADDYPSAQAEIIVATYNAPGFFESLEAMPGALEGWQALLDNGYHPHIASAPLSSNPSSVEGKIKWLERVMVPKFGVSVVQEAVFDRSKWKYGGLALVDDRPNVPRGKNGAKDAEWEHILFGWEHLAEVPMATTELRLLRWKETETLLSILESIERRRATQ
jgi:5'-nucleotidase